MLWQVDEDNVRTDYTYDSARQLTEISRSAVYDGEVCVTPETITEFVRDAAGNTETTVYDANFDQPSVVTDALGNTKCATYDHRGRQVAYWGTGEQPILLGYDEADRRVRLVTFRAGTEIINTDPSERTDGDVTQWTYHPATELELSKIYADGSSEQKTYDAFNRLATITDARGVVKTHTYDVARGLLLSESYSDETNNRTYVYKFLAMSVQISDDAGVRNFAYNSFNVLETEEQCKLSCFVYPCLWLITWDPTQSVATRPLAIQKNGTWYAYGWDLTKNICEIFGQNGYIRSTYAYTPFGAVTTSGDINQPIQWSSEYFDNELSLVYYNYRHYNPTDGCWINRDSIAEQGGRNLYAFVGNGISKLDVNGLIDYWSPTANAPMPYPRKEIRFDRGFYYLKLALEKNYKQLSKYKCTFIVTYSQIGNSNSTKYNTESVLFYTKLLLTTVLKNPLIKVLANHSVQEFSSSLRNTKCICGVISIGHASTEPSRLIFDNNTSIVSSRKEENSNRTDVEELDTRNFLPGNTSALFGCQSGRGENSVAEKKANKFHGTAIGSKNKLNFTEGIPYTPIYRGGDSFVTYEKTSKSFNLIGKECCIDAK